MNRAREVAWCGSGKVLNAGLAAHRLGGPSLTLAPLGGSPLGEIDREFAGLGVPRRWIETRAATRVCTTILDRATGRITELVENGRPLDAARIDAFRAAYGEEAARAEVVVLIGSLPGGAPVSLYRDLVGAARLSAGPRFPRRGPALGPRFETLRGKTQSRGVGADAWADRWTTMPTCWPRCGS